MEQDPPQCDAALPALPENAASTSSSAAPAEEKPAFVRLSKAEKRRVKLERQQQQRTAWRQRQREAHKQQVAQREADRAAALEGMEEADREAFEQAEAEERQRKYDEVCAQNARVAAALQDGLRVAVDLYYGSQMNEREQRSLSAQLGRCCGINRRSQAPVSLHLASLARCPASCLPPNREHLNWKVHLIEEDLETRFAPSDMVFLSPDSDSLLTTLNPSKVYVIGGLVDISVQKRQTLSRACALGAASARLPLREFVPGVANARLPLTLPAVLEILTHVNATGDWARAIEIALPAREYARPPEMCKAARRAAKRAQRDSAGSPALLPVPTVSFSAMDAPTADDGRPVRMALLGDIFVDLHADGVSGLPEWGEDRSASAVHLLPGGSCANTARQLASIAAGFSVSLFSTLGDDELGRHFLRRVTEEALLHEPQSTLRLLPGVAQSCCLILSGVRRVPASAGAPATAEADRAMVSCYSSTSRLSVSECSPALSRGRWDVLHLGGYFNCPRLHNDELLRLCESVHASGGIVSFDPQFDASGRWEGEAGHLARLLPLVDVMLLSEIEASGIAGQRKRAEAGTDTEAAMGDQSSEAAVHNESGTEQLSPHSPAASMAKLVRRYPSSLIVIKQGGHGVSAGRASERWEHPAFPTDVIDATGAGDAFNAGFLFRYAVNRTDVPAALRAGAAAGAAAVARSGACVVPLTEDDLVSLIGSGA